MANNVQVTVHKTAKYGDKRLRTLGPHIWKSLPEHMKAETNFIKFGEYINQWFGSICKCNLCVYLTNKYENHINQWLYELEYKPVVI